MKTSCNTNALHKMPAVLILKAKQNSVQTKKPRFVFYMMLFIMAGFCFVPKGAKSQTWTDNDDFWSVSPFNTKNGSFEIKVLLDNNPSFVNNADLKYDLKGDGKLTSFVNFDYYNGVKSFSDSIYTQTIVQSNITWLYITLYVSNYNKKITTIQISGTWIGLLGDDYMYGSRTATIPIPNSFDIAPVDFVTLFNRNTNQYERKAKVGYRKTVLNGLDSASKIQLVKVLTYSPESQLYSKIATSYAYDYVDAGITSQHRYLQQAYFDHTIDIYGRMNSTSPQIDVPSFFFPNTVAADYDAATHTVNFNWTTYTTNTNYINTDWQVQVSNDPTFTNNVTSATITYHNDVGSYSYSVNKNLSSHMYFRVSRDYNSASGGWKLWDVAVKTDIEIPFVSLNADSAHAVLQTNSSALITWNPRPDAWLPGSSFIITKINNTAGTQSEIKLAEADFNKGAYQDNFISSCVQYLYTLQVVPAQTSSFDALAPVQVQDAVLKADFGTLLKMNASKGYYPDHVTLNWSSTGSFDNFIIQRAEYGTRNYVQILTVPASSGGEYQAEDDKGTPNVYYSYRIIGSLNCNNQPLYSKDTLRTVGFRNPSGNIHGRITYVNGQAVRNATVRTQAKDVVPPAKSLYFDGGASNYLLLDTLYKAFTDTALTLEAWIRPADVQPKNQVIFSRDGQYKLGFDGNGKLYFSYNGSKVTGGYVNLNQAYVHVTGVHSRDSLILLLNDSLIGHVANVYQQTTTVDKQVYIGSSKTGNNNYKGYIDEMRVWNVAHTDSAIAKDYTRFITGGENGLAAYWHFDETIDTSFYDLSHAGTVYNRNDGNIKGNVTHTLNIPTPDQLSFKDYTDSTGNYFIAGIPYTGNGTTYSVVPLLGTHQFDPVSDSRQISPGSTDFTVNFTDKSSFPVSGAIYYSNTTVPVPGVQFKIDGQYVQNGDGSFVQTGDDGSFTLTVPVGVHKVQAVKFGHVFEQNGEILDIHNQQIDYQTPYAGIKLKDSTTIRFIGRVSGGKIQAAYPLGFSLSKNNLGENITVTMKLTGTANYSLNTTQKADSAVTVQHVVLSGSKGAGQPHHSVVDYFSDHIEIHADPLTGEFAADIIPEKFYSDKVNATGWNNILTGNVQFDFTNKFVDFATAYKYTDSTLKDSQHPDSGYVYTDYTDSLKYNDSAVFIKRVTPSLSIVQLDAANKPLSYFGDSTAKYQLVNGQEIITRLVDFKKSGKNAYLLGHPAFSQKLQYVFKVNSFESYPFYSATGVPTDTDVIAVTDGSININNEIRAGATGTDVGQLDSSGLFYYSFIAGDPDISDALQSFSATLQIGQTTSIPWKAYDGSQVMQVYNVGGKSSGSDFVTQGPDNLITVLRDPPGSRSFTYAEKGNTSVRTHSFAITAVQAGELETTAELGPKLVTWLGVGAGIITEYKIENEFSLSIEHEENWRNTTTSTETNTILDRYQTSDDPAFVGAAGDVFVGHSTNIVYGTGSNIVSLTGRWIL